MRVKPHFHLCNISLILFCYKEYDFLQLISLLWIEMETTSYSWCTNVTFNLFPVYLSYLRFPKTSDLLLKSKSIDSPSAGGGLSPHMYFLEEDPRVPSLFETFLIAVPSPAFSDLDDPKEASGFAPNTELFVDWWSSTGCPTAPSWWGGGNFSLLLFPCVCGTTLHLCKTH